MNRKCVRINISPIEHHALQRPKIKSSAEIVLSKIAKHSVLIKLNKVFRNVTNLTVVQSNC
jgi:hypothetical protein